MIDEFALFLLRLCLNNNSGFNLFKQINEIIKNPLNGKIIESVNKASPYGTKNRRSDEIF